MPFKNGDMLLVDYAIYVKETGDLIDTTNAATAKQFKKYEEGRVYEPELVIVGEGRLIKGFEEALFGVEEFNRGYEVEVPPEKAYGVRDPDRVKVFPARIFLKNNVVPEVGREVTVNDNVGRVIAVTGGRVTVDFNHPLAGKTLRVWFAVVRKLEGLEEQIKHLVKRRVRNVDVNSLKLTLRADEGVAEIELPREHRLSENIQITKYLVSRDVLRWLEGFKEVVFIERYSSSEFRGGEVSASGKEAT